MSSSITSGYKFKIFVFFSIIFLMNLLLFLLRFFDREWWALDYSVYLAVDDALHFYAFLSFVFNFVIIFLVLMFVLPKDSSAKFRSTAVERKVGPYMVSLLLALQAFAAIFSGVGVAGGVGEAPVYLYFLFLFSIDFFYLYYAINEKNKKTLFFVTCFFIISNVFRGWASFVVFILLVIWVRSGGLRLKTVLFISPFVFLILSIALHVRDIFRGGFSAYDRLLSEGYGGFKLFYEYINITLVSVVSRFDLYSHYIGISWMSSFPDNACYPAQENIVYLVVSKVLYLDECRSLGSLLPGFLYDFFVGRGTSFSVGSGFYALKGMHLLIYSISYYSVLFFSVLIARFALRSRSEYVVFGFLVLYIFSQGWNYQYVYMLSGLIVASVYYRSTFKKVY